MDFYLATSWGDPIEARGSEQTILARIHTNRARALYRMAPEEHVQDVRPRTNDKQRELKNALQPWAQRQNDQLRGADD